MLDWQGKKIMYSSKQFMPIWREWSWHYGVGIFLNITSVVMGYSESEFIVFRIWLSKENKCKSIEHSTSNYKENNKTKYNVK